MTYNAGDRGAVERRAKDFKHEEKRRLNFLRNCMASGEGRDFFYSLLARCHCHHSPWVRGETDATAFNLGEQNIGLMILADLVKASPELYLKMLSEQNDRANTDPDRDAGNQPGDRRDDPDSLAGYHGYGDE